MTGRMRSGSVCPRTTVRFLGSPAQPPGVRGSRGQNAALSAGSATVQGVRRVRPGLCSQSTEWRVFKHLLR